MRSDQQYKADGSRETDKVKIVRRFESSVGRLRVIDTPTIILTLVRQIDFHV